MKGKRYIIGIDPDLDRSGLAVWDQQLNRWFCHEAISNSLLVERLGEINPAQADVYVEAGWLVKKSNFHGGKRGISDAISRKVGQNQAVGKLLCERLTLSGFLVTEIAPLRKGVLKVSGKWTPAGKEYIVKQTGITSRINDEVRDSLLIVLRYRP